MLNRLCILCLIASCSLFAQRPELVAPKSPFVLNLDYAKFKNDERSSYLEIYYAFYPRLMTFEHVEGKFRGWVRLWTRLRNSETGQLLVNETAALPIAVADTSVSGPRSTIISQAGYAVPFGEYILEVEAVDSLEQTRRDSITLVLPLKPSGTDVNASDIELCSLIKNSDQKSDPFYKNSLEVVPNPTLVFGVTSHPVVFAYAEVYNIDREKTYTVKNQVIAGDGAVVKEGTKSRKYGVPNAVEVVTTNVGSIVSGKYRYRLVLEDEAGAPVTQTEKTFYVYNPHIQVATLAPISVKASELAGLSADELQDEFNKAQYLATDQEIKSFSQITSADGRREFLAKFWVDVEPGRLGRFPVTRMQYLNRVGVANQRYRALSRDGWKTDRGRVLVLFAEPDEIERYPSTENNKPYEVWHYYGIENGVQFVFVDRTGFGDYVLVHSTKRGELRDDAWQRYLQ